LASLICFDSINNLSTIYQQFVYRDTQVARSLFSGMNILEIRAHEEHQAMKTLLLDLSMVNIMQIETGSSRTASLLINPATPACPPAVAKKLQKMEIQRVWATGDLCILEKCLLAFFCSSKCPGNVILAVYDLARILRDAGVPIISGFHSPMEKECLDLLLRGEQPIVICPGRSIEGMRIPSAWQQAISDKRLLLLSPFDPKERRLTKALAEIRNSFVATIASSILVAHASTNGTIHKLVTGLLSSGRRIFTLDLPENEAPIQNGVSGVPVGELPSFVKSIRSVH
jgi:hypothetical protein